MSATHPSESRYRRILANRRGGESLRALADRRGVNVRTLYWWNQKLLQREREQEPGRTPAVPALVPVTGTEGFGLTSILAPDFEVALRGSGHVVRVPARFEDAALRRLVEVLEAQ